MPFYSIYIYDDRYSVPTLDVVVALDDVQATEMAVEKLSNSSHYLAVEIFEGERLVYKTHRDAVD